MSRMAAGPLLAMRDGSLAFHQFGAMVRDPQFISTAPILLTLQIALVTVIPGRPLQDAGIPDHHRHPFPSRAGAS